MKIKSGLFTDIGFFIFGFIFFAAGIYSLNEKMEFFKHTIEAEGTIIDIESRSGKNVTYHPVVTFQAKNGNSYTFTSTSSSNDFTKGQKLKIMYKEENPQMARINSFKERWGLPLAFLISGMVIALRMAVKIYKMLYRKKLSNELPRTGTRLQLIGRVEVNSSKHKDGFVVISEWLNPSDSKMYAFTSDNILYDPSSYIANRMLDVWVDPKNPKKKHYVDVSFLPKKA